MSHGGPGSGNPSGYLTSFVGWREWNHDNGGSGQGSGKSDADDVDDVDWEGSDADPFVSGEES